VGLPRTPEPEVMDAVDQAVAYAQADFSAPNQAFVDRLLAHWPALSGRVLDLGCGPADIPIRLCRARPVHVTAVDASAAMIACAQEAVGGAALTEAIDLVCGRVPDALDPAARYDAVLSNSLLHHLPDPAVLWDAVARHARPGAPVLVADLTRPADAAELDDLVQTYSAHDPPVLQRDFRASLHAAFTVDEVRDQLERAGLQHLHAARISDRHLAVHGTR
jgi:SAM-dependent methyltransferase